MSGLTQMREQYKDEFFKKHGVKLGFMSTFVKASATALMENPMVNACTVITMIYPFFITKKKKINLFLTNLTSHRW